MGQLQNFKLSSTYTFSDIESSSEMDFDVVLQRGIFYELDTAKHTLEGKPFFNVVENHVIDHNMFSIMADISPFFSSMVDTLPYTDAQQKTSAIQKDKIVTSTSEYMNGWGERWAVAASVAEFVQSIPAKSISVKKKADEVDYLCDGLLNIDDDADFVKENDIGLIQVESLLESRF